MYCITKTGKIMAQLQLYNDIYQYTMMKKTIKKQ